ncbi:uncharacterized protein A1O5_03304 [Cladophialophora psammophila CBS 110553]|uniref:Uncharacterized protein n=1 Tax=Cladophialophora psammophila CBS 110553 TaxID=1182543 RepID=W9X027_9EURO|nr:uncharacterized protein A1O5_03304 [Cladophialophora psammophila CBS 110553]EXJ73543.1 hypothetical protein A1O5_03304 [Cladophialophora psammophila CBS 110553]
MYEVLNQTREIDKNDKYTLAVVSTEEFASLLESKFDKPWWKKLMTGVQRREGCPVTITTAKRLQKAIDLVESYLKAFEKAEIFMLVHASVRRMSFHVAGDDVDTLTIMRWHGASASRENLIIDGASTFAATRLDDWQVNDDRNLYIGKHGISICVDTTKSSVWADAASRPWGELPSHRLEELRSALHETDGLSSETDWWDKWKGPAAAVLGVIAGTTKMAAGLKAAAGGFYVKYAGTFALTTHTLEVGAANAKITAIATAAGPALLLGASVAAAVYFIPWKRFFNWLGGILPRIFEACQQIWEWFASWFARFTEWVRDTFQESSRCRPRQATFSA